MLITSRRANIRRVLFFCLLLWLPAALVADELAALLEEAERVNPGIQAASWRVEQALLKHQELLEFLDPSWQGAVGKSEAIRSIPGAVGYTSLAGNSREIQAGIQIPVPAGAYVTLGSVVMENVSPGLQVTGNYAIEHKKFLAFLKTIR